MKQSVGYSVTLNIVIVFIVIIFTFLSATLIYYKSNKVSNIITETIEKYEGYNEYSRAEISQRLTALGYNKNKLRNCGTIDGCELQYHGDDGYCVNTCDDTERPCYYYYRIKTNMLVNVPIVNDFLELPIYANTVSLFDFEESFVNPSCSQE